MRLLGWLTKGSAALVTGGDPRAQLAVYVPEYRPQNGGPPVEAVSAETPATSAS